MDWWRVVLWVSGIDIEEFIEGCRVLFNVELEINVVFDIEKVGDIVFDWIDWEGDLRGMEMEIGVGLGSFFRDLMEGFCVVGWGILGFFEYWVKGDDVVMEVVKVLEDGGGMI